jgi:hypothetical protein
VLRAAIGKLPVVVQPLARTVAAKLGLAEAERPAADDVARLAEDFDVEVAGLLLAPELTERSGAQWDAAAMEAADGGVHEGPDPISELDDARQRLAEQLVGMPAGADPSAEIEQFLPAVLAVRPLIKLGISAIGRDRVVRFIADRIAGLVKGMVGENGARQLARPLVDVGLRMLGFEVSPTTGTTLAGEALASTVEGTVLRLLELPEQAFADELQLDAAIQNAFAEAAAAFIPDRLLRPDLPERETAGEGGVWVLVPRLARPRFRYRRYTRVFAVPVSRQVARVIPWTDGGTLEAYLLDRGAQRWPVQAQVDLYEAMPGTQLGHLAAEPEGTAADEGSGDGSGVGEVQPLSPEVAGLLLGEPGLGRRVAPATAASATVPSATAASATARPVPGRRYFRIRPLGLAGQAPARPRRRVAVWFDLTGANPAVRVALRLTERQAQQLLGRLEPAARGGQRDLPGTLAELRRHYQAALPAAVVARVLRGGLATDAAHASAIADQLVAGITAALSGFLTQRAAALVAAVRDPTNGITLTVTFAGVSKQTLASALPTGQVSVAPGWPRRG